MPSKPLTTCRVLYLEDSVEDQRILLEAIGFAAVAVELVTANNAPAALQLLDEQLDFDVLLLDWNLPMVSGVEFLEAVRQNNPELPVIVLTGEPATVDVPHASRFGVETILRKPIMLEEWEGLAARLFQHCGDTSAIAAAPQ